MVGRLSQLSVTLIVVFEQTHKQGVKIQDTLLTIYDLIISFGHSPVLNLSVTVFVLTTLLVGAYIDYLLVAVF